jgi:hypothetical protein
MKLLLGFLMRLFAGDDDDGHGSFHRCRSWSFSCRASSVPSAPQLSSSSSSLRKNQVSAEESFLLRFYSAIDCIETLGLFHVWFFFVRIFDLISLSLLFLLAWFVRNLSLTM